MSCGVMTVGSVRDLSSEVSAMVKSESSDAYGR